MVRFSVCIEMIFKELPFLDRIDAVAQNSLPAFEFWQWSSKDISGILERKRRHELAISAFCVEPFDIPLVESKANNDFITAVNDAINVAHKLGCSRLIVQSGNQIQNMPKSIQHNNIVANLREVAPMAEKADVMLALEPLNRLVDFKDYYLDTFDEGLSIVKDVNSANVKILFDIYHQQISQGNIINTITKNVEYIDYIHVADVPGRHEPGTGELNFTNILSKIDELGYDIVGLEFRPTADSKEALEKTLKTLPSK